MDITPGKLNLESVFGGTKYYIDFYQREYRWPEEVVTELLDDLFHVFNANFPEFATLEPSESAVANYPWYYLNTYVTNEVEGSTYLVDGQQRLTTLSLILTKLVHLVGDMESTLIDWIKPKVYGQTGHEKTFWINHVGNENVQMALLEQEKLEEEALVGDTAKHLVSNFAVVSKRLDEELADKVRLETFCFYFLYRVVMVELSVEQTNVPMVFEVINDRGVSLLPYEILKGKLLGQIDKKELDSGGYNELWEKRIQGINQLEEDAADDFFRQWLRGRFADTRGVGQRYDGDYHREMFSARFASENVDLRQDPSAVKTFLREDFDYYAGLYARLRQVSSMENSEFPHAFYNELLRLEIAPMLAISVCKVNDPDEEEKLRVVTRELDRIYALLQLQGAHDSTQFNEEIYKISAALRDAPVGEFRSVFDEHLIGMLETRKGSSSPSPFNYGSFRQTGANLNQMFRRYFFARIDEFIARGMSLEPKHPISDLVLKTGAVNGFHIEHILSWNDDNRGLFDEDEDAFEVERNRLGGLLLLKGRDNISSGNEPYADKLKTYANTLYWNETLRPDTYTKAHDFVAFRTEYDLEFTPLHQFGPDELEQRHRLLFDLASIIWG